MSIAQRLVDHFGGKQEAADSLNVNRETIRLWLRDGIPLQRALFVEEKTEGNIKADDVLKEARRPRRRK